MVEIVFFDIDDTLVNHSDAERKAILHMGQSFFPNVDPHFFETTWLEMTGINWELFRRGEKTFAQQRIGRIQDVWERFGRVIGPDEAENHFGQYLTVYEEHRELLPDVCEVLEEFHRRAIKLGIISNGNSDQRSSGNNGALQQIASEMGS